MHVKDIDFDKAPTTRRYWPLRMAFCLLCLSYATALFTLSVFKVLSFFIMPSLFFDLLFIGFPVGAWMGARFGSADRRVFFRCLWGLTAIMAASVACCLLAKRFDYLRAHLFDIELSRLVGQVGIFVVMFMPFFVAYGLCEYLGYQVGRRHLGGRMRLVYALALFGAVLAYLSLKVLLSPLGMARMLALAFACLALAILTLGEGWTRWAAAIEVGMLMGVSCFPGLERGFLGLYKGHGAQSTWDYETGQGCESVFQKWGRYGLCEILASPDRKVYYGFYNDMFQWEFGRRRGFTRASLGAIPVLLTKPGQRLAIVGAGGGRQVRLAELLEGRSIVAIELEPAVFEAVRSPEYLLSAFGRVYESPDVTPVRAEARGYFEGSSQKFDLIYLPSVGGYPQMMIEPGNMVRTYQAYRTMRDRLDARGILAIWYPSGLDTRGILTAQYVRTLRSLGLTTEAYRNDIEFLILAFRDPKMAIPKPSDLDHFLTMGSASFATSAEFQAVRPRIYPVGTDPDFVPITDQKPFLAGNVRYILSINQVFQLFGIALVALGFAGAAVWWVLRRRGNPQIPDRSFSAVAGLALLIGANFLMIEHTLVLSLFQRLYVYDDVLGMGAIGFLTLSGVGSLLAGRWLRPAFLIASAVTMAAFLATAERLSVSGLVLALVPVALATGMFFPALSNWPRQNPLAVFAFDAVGAGLGALAATFIPIAWGIDTFVVVAGAVFLLTVIVDAWFHHHLDWALSKPRTATATVTTAG